MPNGFLSRTSSGVSALLLRVVGGISVRPRVLTIGSNMTLADNGDGTATLAASAAATHTHVEADVTSLVADLAAAGGTAHSLQLTVYNDTGGALTKGTCVYDTNNGGDTHPTVGVLDSTTNYGRNILLGVLAADIADAASGLCTTFGELDGLDTSGFSVGDALTCDNLGQLSTSAWSTNYAGISVGPVITSHATTGSIFVLPKRDRVAIHTHNTDGAGGNTLGNLTLQQTVANSTGSILTKGTLLSSAPPFLVAGMPNVQAAGVGRGDFVGVAVADIAISPGTGLATIRGLVTDLDTSAFAAVGDPVFVGESGDVGAAQIAPTTSSSGFVIGYIVTKHATTGSIFVWPDLGAQELYLHEVLSGTDAAPDTGYQSVHAETDHRLHIVEGTGSTDTAIGAGSILLPEISTPATPAAGYQVIFVDVSDHLVKAKDSAAAVRTLG